MRGIIATVRNVVDFGAFVDFGLENDGLLHRSNMGSVPMGSLLVGQDIGIDVLGVAKADRISVGLSGLNLPADSRYSKPPPKSGAKKSSKTPRSGPGGGKRLRHVSDGKRKPQQKQQHKRQRGKGQEAVVDDIEVIETAPKRRRRN